MRRALDGAAVRFGKPLDVLALKGIDLDGVRGYAEHLHKRAQTLYAPGSARRELVTCPCCSLPTSDAKVELVAHGVPYHRCASCGHAFVRLQPAPEALERLYAEEEELSATYTDRASLEVRMEQVVRPKVAWAIEVFERRFQRRPRSAVDVGAGGGHIVEGLRRAGVSAEGYELSASSRRFAAEAFGIELRSADFLSEPIEAELVTFFGLLEYTPEPDRFLTAACRALAGEAGLLVVEVPRIDCVGTAVQKTWPETIARHLDPTSHVNCFSDESIEVALGRAGFEPVAAWYFGMDAYELLVQLALRGGAEVGKHLAEPILSLQQAFDAARLCDDVVVAAVPAG